MKIMDELQGLNKEELLQVINLLQMRNSKAEADLYDILTMIRVNKRARGRAQQFCLFQRLASGFYAYLQAVYQGSLTYLLEDQREYTRKHDLHTTIQYIITFYTVSPHPFSYVYPMFKSYTDYHTFTTQSKSFKGVTAGSRAASVKAANRQVKLAARNNNFFYILIL